MPRPIALLFASFLVLSVRSAHAALNVVATLPDLAALAKEVGGEDVVVTALSSASQDPHYVDPKPSFVVALSRADLLVVNGMDLEVGWLPKLQQQARNAKIAVGGTAFLNVSQFVNVLDVPTTKVDRSMGDVHPGGNPHYLYDPRAAAKVAKGLGEKLAALDGARGAAYRARAEGVAARLLALAERESARFHALPAEARKVVSYHRSLPYLLDWLGLTEEATVEPKPGIPPNPSHVATVLERMRNTGTKVIVQEAHHPTSTTETLAKLAGARLVRIQGGTEFAQGETYQAHVERMGQELYAGLGGTP